MCRCEQPTVNGTGDYKHHLRPPELSDGDELLRDLPGRCGREIDSHAFHFRVVKRGRYSLMVMSGAGQQVIDLGYRKTIPDTIASMSDDDAYWLCQAMYHAMDKHARCARNAEKSRWAAAAANKRIRTRKMRNSDTVKVRIAPAENDQLCFSL